MESWRMVWRQGFAPQFTDDQLLALKKALDDDDPRLLQGCTTTPPPLLCVTDWPVEGCCVIGFCGWSTGLDTVGEVEEFFAKSCFEADAILNEPAACRWFLNAWDDTPRKVMFHELSTEVEYELKRRSETSSTAHSRSHSVGQP